MVWQMPFPTATSWVIIEAYPHPTLLLFLVFLGRKVSCGCLAARGANKLIAEPSLIAFNIYIYIHVYTCRLQSHLLRRHWTDLRPGAAPPQTGSRALRVRAHLHGGRWTTRRCGAGESDPTMASKWLLINRSYGTVLKAFLVTSEYV